MTSGGQHGHHGQPYERPASHLEPAGARDGPRVKPVGRLPNRVQERPPCRSAAGDAASPPRLVDVAWLLGLQRPGTVVVEVGADDTSYHEGHVPGAVALSWLDELSDPDRRGVLSQARWEGLLGVRGITADSHLVFYGDEGNVFAAYAYWLARYYGHEAVSLLDGGRQAWLDAEGPLEQLPPARCAARYVSSGPRPNVRVLRDDVLHLYGGGRGGVAVVDCRSRNEFAGHHGSVVQLPVLRHRLGGHMPGAVNVSSSHLVDARTGRLLPRERLERMFAAVGLQPSTDTVVYCDAGGRSSLTWFVLHELLGYERVRNYDGGWAEYGSLVGAPVQR